MHGVKYIDLVSLAVAPARFIRKHKQNRNHKRYFTHYESIRVTSGFEVWHCTSFNPSRAPLTPTNTWFESRSCTKRCFTPDLYIYIYIYSYICISIYIYIYVKIYYTNRTWQMRCRLLSSIASTEPVTMGLATKGRMCIPPAIQAGKWDEANAVKRKLEELQRRRR